MPGHVQAVMVRRTGGPEVLELTDLPRTALAPHALRVRAHAIGVGKPDMLIRQGVYRWMPPLPAVLGNELAGEVVEVGSDVQGGWRLGQRVLVSGREMPQRGGCYASEVCVPAHTVFSLPDHVAYTDAVALPNYQLAGALLYHSGGRAPTSVLVHGAAGGVAVAVVQLAQVDGVLALATASTQAKCDFARAAGARHVIHRASQSVHAEVMRLTAQRGVDMVLDHVAGPGFTDNLQLLAPLGSLISYNVLAGLPSTNLLGEMRAMADISPAVRTFTIHTLDRDPPLRRQLMQRAIDLLAQGRIAPAAPTVFALADVQAAHRLLDQGDVLGKIVLAPDRT